jgi:hypothetical protein
MKYLVFLLPIFLLFACNANKMLVATNCKAVVKTNEPAKEPYGLKIEKVSIKQNCMIIDAVMSYNDIKADAFDLRWNGKMKKSMPPQVTLVLHKDKGNEGFDTKKYQLKFDLSVLNSMGKSMITLKGWDERIEYNPTTNE